ncbi:MAG: helix-turn-helix transcriptional regulator, partial [Lachnospiraceae bacterium]|nr:helix-turn-helix transcriptional regulator [Lachnospiraceae bacterium]
MNIEIANRLVNLRKANNLSQEALAEKLGISRQAVSKWERAEASPDTDNLILLARLYGVSLDELLRTEDEIPIPEEEPEKKEGTSSDDFARAWNSGDINENTNIHIGKEGIYVQKDGERLHIGWNGIHVEEDDGEDVHVGWKGVHINEHGKSFFDRSAFNNGEKDDWDGIH